MTLNYLIFTRLKNLYFRQIIWLFVEANRINSNYLFFWTFVIQSRIIIRLWCHFRFIYSNYMNKIYNSNSKLAEFYLIFVQMLFNIPPWTIIFVISLLVDLGYRGLWLTLRTNLESGPQFAEVWCAHRALLDLFQWKTFYVFLFMLHLCRLKMKILNNLN